VCIVFFSRAKSSKWAFLSQTPIVQDSLWSHKTVIGQQDQDKQQQAFSQAVSKQYVYSGCECSSIMNRIVQISYANLFKNNLIKIGAINDKCSIFEGQ
jgi:hypothetical protein